jgi:hypothetical protein
MFYDARNFLCFCVNCYACLCLCNVSINNSICEHCAVLYKIFRKSFEIQFISMAFIADDSNRSINRSCESLKESPAVVPVVYASFFSYGSQQQQ